MKIICEEPSSLMCSFLYSLDAAWEELSSMLAVRNYTNVFQELTSLPLLREEEFCIDLVRMQDQL